jgi:hypothetical protein
VRARVREKSDHRQPWGEKSKRTTRVRVPQEQEDHKSTTPTGETRVTAPTVCKHTHTREKDSQGEIREKIDGFESTLS